MFRIVAAFGVLFAVAASAAGSPPVPNGPYVQSMDGGAFYARCVPAADAGPAGTTKVYRVGRDADELVDTYDWYAQEGVVLGWSPLAGKVTVMARGGKPGPDGRRVELSFHLGGRQLAAYTAADLEELGVEVPLRRTPSGRPEPRADVRAVRCEQVPGTNEYDFVVESGGRQFRFDILTGRSR